MVMVGGLKIADLFSLIYLDPGFHVNLIVFHVNTRLTRLPPQLVESPEAHLPSPDLTRRVACHPLYGRAPICNFPNQSKAFHVFPMRF